MKLSELYNAQTLAAQQTEAASNRIPFLGEGLFPSEKKMGLTLKNIRAHKGLPVSLAPSNFDAKSVLRGREGMKISESEMAFFRESMLVKEADEQEIMRIQDADDPYVAEVLRNIYDDAGTLVDGARVVPERMRMQLLAPVTDGSPRIVIEANGVQYSYNYDADGSYKTSNYKAITTENNKWSDAVNSDPLADLNDAIDAVEELSGSRPAYVIMSKKTMGYLKQNAKVKGAVLAQNMSANVFMNDARVTELMQAELGVTPIVYSKQYKDEEKVAHAFYPDDMVTLIPEGALGQTWYGTTPEERTLMGNPTADVAVVDTGITVAVTATSDPVNTKTTVSEIVLPSYERMDETYVIKVN